MSLQTERPLHRLRATVTNRGLSDLVEMVNRGDMSLDAPYQRGGVWTLDQRVGLIRSLLLGVPIPAIVINDRGSQDWTEGPIEADEPFYVVIDGKQRIQTMVDWFAGHLLVPASWWELEHIEYVTSIDRDLYVCWPELTRIGQRVFTNHATIAVCEGRLASVREEFEVFGLVNGQGTPMTSADMRRAAMLREA